MREEGVGDQGHHQALTGRSQDSGVRWEGERKEWALIGDRIHCRLQNWKFILKNCDDRLFQHHRLPSFVSLLLVRQALRSPNAG